MRQLAHQDLVEIFKQLPVKDLISCSLVSKAWHEAANDILLWKQLLVKDFAIKKKHLANKPNDCDFKSEYIRLCDEGPSVLLQTLESHKDEVLDLAFSKDGTEMVSCSRVSPTTTFISKQFASELAILGSAFYCLDNDLPRRFE